MGESDIELSGDKERSPLALGLTQREFNLLKLFLNESASEGEIASASVAWITDKDKLPIEYQEVTVPLNITSDSEIIRSVYSTAGSVCKITRHGNTVTFWRQPPAPVKPPGTVKFRAKPNDRWRDSEAPVRRAGDCTSGA